MYNLMQLLASIINVSIIRRYISSVFLSDLRIMNMAWNPALYTTVCIRKFIL